MAGVLGGSAGPWHRGCNPLGWRHL